MPKNSHRKWLSIISKSFLLLLTFASLPAYAVISPTWVGGTGCTGVSCPWNVAANWTTPATVPGNNPSPFDTANIGAGGGGGETQAIVSGDNFTLNLLNFNRASPLTGSFVVAVNGTGVLTLAGTGVALNDPLAGQIVIGELGGSPLLQFKNSATAANVPLETSLPGSGSILFQDTSTAGTSSINVSGGFLTFENSSTAANSSILNFATTTFQDTSTSANASITNGTGGTLTFTGSATGTTGTSITLNNSTVDISGLIVPSLTVGRITDAALASPSSITLGANNLITGGANQNDSLSGVISGIGGSLTKNGTGTLILTGNNTYTGNTTISGGTLQLGNAGTTGSVAGNIIDNAALVFDRTDSVTYGNVISGNGTVTQAGTGTLIFTNTNTYTGNTIISNGILQLGNGAATGSVAGNIIDNTALVFDPSAANLTYGGVISGGGTVQQLANTTILTGNNTYTGLTTISGGTLQLGNGGTSGSIAGSILDNATLVFDRSDTLTYGGAISGSGGVTQLGTGTLIFTGNNTYVGNTNIVFAPLQLGNGGTSGSVSGNIVNSGGLIFDRSDSVTYGGVISGPGTLAQNGSGTVTLNGTNTFSGTTTINAGNLALGDSLHPAAAVGGDVNINPGTTLSGFGRVGANVTNNGTIAPGAGTTIGALAIGLNYTQTATGTYITYLDTPTHNDMLNIGGTATLNNGIVDVLFENGFQNFVPYTILTAGNVVGQFTLVDPPFLKGKLLYFPTHVDFIVTFNNDAFDTAAMTPNQKSVANYILQTGGTAAVQDLIASLETDEQFRVAMDQLSGATYATQSLMLTRVGNWFSSALSDRFERFPRCESSTWDPGHCCCKSCDAQNQLWIAGHGANESISADDVSGLSASVGNFAFGQEIPLTACSKIGFAGGYTDISGNIQGGNELGSMSGDLYQMGIYGYGRQNCWSVGAEVDVGLGNHLESRRHVQGATGVSTLEGNYDARLWTEQARVNYDLAPRCCVRVSPFVGVIAQQLNRGAITERTESGVSGFELAVATTTFYSTRSQLGALLEVPTCSTFKPFVSVDWEHEFSNQRAVFDANFVGVGGSFHIESASVGRDTALVKAGAVLLSGRNWNVAALYQGWYGQGWQENGGTLEASLMLG